jgi:methionyl-tRNA formyltransferase
MKNYIVATIKPWNIDAFNRHEPSLPGRWFLISEKNDLSLEKLKSINPRYIFFPHWSWIVPDEILNAYECVCFHMTDVPYGRGGSPLQNLIARGHTDTKLTALKMTHELDAGPVYVKRDLGLHGRAQDIFERSADLIYEMASEIAAQEPKPIPQIGDPVMFGRRTPEMSELPKTGSVQAMYDHIRMLDAETYPHAFVRHGDFVIELSDADIKDGGVTARAFIKKSDTD